MASRLDSSPVPEFTVQRYNGELSGFVNIIGPSDFFCSEISKMLQEIGSINEHFCIINSLLNCMPYKNYSKALVWDIDLLSHYFPAYINDRNPFHYPEIMAMCNKWMEFKCLLFSRHSIFRFDYKTLKDELKNRGYEILSESAYSNFNVVINDVSFSIRQPLGKELLVITNNHLKNYSPHCILPDDLIAYSNNPRTIELLEKYAELLKTLSEALNSTYHICVENMTTVKTSLPQIKKRIKESGLLKENDIKFLNNGDSIRMSIKINSNIISLDFVSIDDMDAFVNIIKLAVSDPENSSFYFSFYRLNP